MAIPSAEFDQLCGIAERAKVFLSVGIIEKEGGTLYCTSVLIDRTGKPLYSHRKVCSTSLLIEVFYEFNMIQLIPTAAERLVWGRGAGDGLTVVNTDIGKVGGLIW